MGDQTRGTGGSAQEAPGRRTTTTGRGSTSGRGETRSTLIGLGVVAAVVLLVVGVAQQWPQKAWIASGISCGWDVEDAAESFDPAWHPWGEVEYPDDAMRAAERVGAGADAEEIRETLAEVGELYGAQPVAEIPRWSGEATGGDGEEITVLPYGEAVGLSQDEHRAAVDPATGELRWALDFSQVEGVSTVPHAAGGHLHAAASAPGTTGPDRVAASRTDRLVHDLETGERLGCTRVGEGGGLTAIAPSGETGLRADWEGWNPYVSEEEQADRHDVTVEGVEFPDWSTIFTREHPAEPPRDDSRFPERQDVAALDDDVYVTYPRDLAAGRLAATSIEDWPAEDAVPVRAHSMTDGEELWTYGEPGDLVAVVESVRLGPGEHGLLVAEFTDFELDEPGDEWGDAQVRLSMLDAAGERLWTQESASTAEDGESERYVTVADGVVLFTVGEQRFRAVDAATGEELWTFDEQLDDWAPDLWLHTAAFVDGLVYLHGHERDHVLDQETGERVDAPEVAILGTAGEVVPVRAVGDDHLLLTWWGSHVVLERG